MAKTAKKRKFSKKAFREWLDCIAKVTCKTDDNFSCQIHITDCGHDDCSGCSIYMFPKSFDCQWCHIKSKESYAVRWLAENALTGCGHCHTWAHDNPVEFGLWFAKYYPHRLKIINEKIREPNKVWRESDFREMEAVLLLEAKRVGVDYMNAPKRFQMRLKRKLEELRAKK